MPHIGGFIQYILNLNFDSMLFWFSDLLQDKSFKQVAIQLKNGCKYSCMGPDFLDGILEVIVCWRYRSFLRTLNEKSSLTFEVHQWLTPFKNYSSTDVAFLMHLESWCGHTVSFTSSVEETLATAWAKFFPSDSLFPAHCCFGLHTLLWKSCQFVSPIIICITTVFVYFKPCK